jgi:predicted HicB family RNase H-like nuclease
MGKKKRLNLTIDEDVIKAAKKKAIDEDTSISEVVEKSLREWAKDPPIEEKKEKPPPE